MNLAQQRKDLCAQKNKVWMKQMKDDTNEVRGISLFGLEESIL